MKVTRLKRGYVIRLSDNEFEMLASLVSEGEGGICTDGPLETQGIPKLQANAYWRRIEAANQFLGIDEDRRA
jgi:hypothetical protein